MMNRRTLFFVFCLALLAAGCVGVPRGYYTRVWIDAPTSGSTYELGPIIVRSHAASDGGTAQAALLVNGEQVRVDAAPDPASPLVEFAQSWVPEREGRYVLQVISRDHWGNEGHSSRVYITVGQDDRPAYAITPSPTVTTTPTELTPTPTGEGPPTIHFDQNANCRLGDTTGYEVVTSFSEGEERPIDGRNAATTWFWVLMPQGGHCWVAGSTGTLSGPYESVPIIAPPTLTPAPEDGDEATEPPNAPGNLQVVELTCSNQDGYKVRLSWQDNSDNESGFRIYHNGSPIATVGANVEQFDHQVGGDISQQQNYRVEAYNTAGAAQSNAASEDGCLY